MRDPERSPDGYVGTTKLHAGRRYRFTVATPGQEICTVTGKLKEFVRFPPAQAMIVLADDTEVWRGDIIDVQDMNT